MSKGYSVKTCASRFSSTKAVGPDEGIQFGRVVLQADSLPFLRIYSYKNCSPKFMGGISRQDAYDLVKRGRNKSLSQLRAVSPARKLGNKRRKNRFQFARLFGIGQEALQTIQRREQRSNNEVFVIFFLFEC